MRSLKTKELYGLYCASSARVFLLVVVAGAAILTAKTTLQTVFALSFAGVVLGATVFAVNKIKMAHDARWYGYLGSALDLALLAYMPYVWQSALGGSAIPFAYTTKTMFFFVSLLVLIINVLTLRPAYPLIIGIGSAVIHAVILVLARLDANTVFSTTLLDITGANTIVVNFQFALILGNILAGGIAGFACHTVQVLAQGDVSYAVDAHGAQKNDELFDDDEKEDDLFSEDDDFDNAFSSAKSTSSANAFSTQSASTLPSVSSLNSTSATTLPSQSTSATSALKTLLTKQPAKMQNMAVLYTSIWDFDNLRATLSPSRVIDLLSAFRRTVQRLATTLGGTVDTSLGEGVQVLFGTVIPRTNDAEMCVRLAIRLQNELINLNSELMKQKLPPVNIGIGVHFGSAIVGTCTEAQGAQTVIIGDGVDTARRVEAACKTTQKTLLFTGVVKQLLPQSFVVRPVGYCKLRGKEERIELYTATSEPAR